MQLDLELIIRIVVGAALGAVIGYERDIHGRPAGLRTHTMVALASATFMVVSTHLAFYQHYTANDFTQVDGSRIAASVVSGIGFLAGGAILRTGLSIQGLPIVEGWHKESAAAAVRQLTLAIRLPRLHGEAVLVCALEAEPGITRMQLDAQR